MQTEIKKRVDIVVERSLLDTIIELINDAGATGYTVLPCLAGRGEHGPWRSGDLSPAFDRVYFVVIASDEVAESVVTQIAPYLDRYAAVLSVTDTRVLRGDRF